MPACLDREKPSDEAEIGLCKLASNLQKQPGAFRLPPYLKTQPAWRQSQGDKTTFFSHLPLLDPPDSKPDVNRSRYKQDIPDAASRASDEMTSRKRFRYAE